MPGKSHGRRSLEGCSPWGLRVGHDWATSLSCIGEGNGNPLQCSCLENPRDGGAWWAAIYGVAQSRTQVKRLSRSSSRASSSSGAKNIINQIVALTIWWCPCVESSLVLLKEGVCYDQCVLSAKLLVFALLHFVLQGQTCVLLQVSTDFLLCIPIPMMKSIPFFGVSSRMPYRSS